MNHKHKNRNRKMGKMKKQREVTKQKSVSGRHVKCPKKDFNDERRE